MAYRWHAIDCCFVSCGFKPSLVSTAGRIPDIGPIDDLQRSYQMDQYRELAKSGPARGENIYLYKCFYCHNHYAKGGPALENLFQHPHLNSGKPVNDQTVAAQIANGSLGMPGYRYSLSNEEMGDLIGYLRSKNGRCQVDCEAGHEGW